MNEPDLSRRGFLCSGVVGAFANGSAVAASDPLPPELAVAVDKIEPYFTDPDQFGDVSRGNPVPHRLADNKKKEVGLTRDTWKLEVVTDSESPATLAKQLTRK